MAKALGMQVTAEGIETEVQATLARAAGCDQMQGWLYSRAVPALELERQLAVQAEDIAEQAQVKARSAKARAVNS